MNKENLRISRVNNLQISMAKAIKTTINQIPSYEQLMWPTLKALKTLGGSASIQELVDKIIEIEGYSEDIQKTPHTGSGRETKIEYNAAWARTYLKKVGAINNSQKGVWVLLEHGENLSQKDIIKIPKIVKSLLTEEKKIKNAFKALRKIDAEELNEDQEEQNDRSWKDQLLNKITQIKPYDFERLCQLILRESGFIKVKVTGKSGDGGIDGMGILRVNLLSFHVSFQCKRYQGSVGSSQIRDFRGAVVGRGDKGLFITTGTSLLTRAKRQAEMGRHRLI